MENTGKIIAVCVSEKKGTQKSNVNEAELIAGHGIKGDAHAGEGHRQVSLLSYNKIEDFKAMGAEVSDGAFGENLVVEGIDLARLPVGAVLCCGDAVLEVTQLGKQCHQHCQIYHKMGDCIMPREGVFAKVLRGGIVKTGDVLNVRRQANGFRAAIVTASDKGASGRREDLSGAVIKDILETNGYELVSYKIIADEQLLLERELKRLCDDERVALIVTTGGTGFSPRDCMPEATINVAHRNAPGIAEAMRQNSMSITKRAMLSRGVAAIRGQTLIVNLPGSPKAVRENLAFIIDVLSHGLDILTGRDAECAR